MNLSAQEKVRYRRHLMLEPIGVAGQLALKRARVLIVGVGGLGCASSAYLAAAGVGTLGLVDSDRVELTNLQRQILYSSLEVGLKKVVCAKRRLSRINSGPQIQTHFLRLSGHNAQKLINGYDIVVDGTDNLETRDILNRFCVQSNKPYIYGSVRQFEGQVAVFCVSGGPCFRCFCDEIPKLGEYPAPASQGILGAVPAVIGALQAIEAVKLIVLAGQPLIGRMLLLDALSMQPRVIRMPPNCRCAVCAKICKK